jgi:hypothetical protein
MNAANIRVSRLIILIALILLAAPVYALSDNDSKSSGPDNSKSMDLMDRINLGRRVDLSKFRIKQPSVMEKEWRDYKNFQDHRNLIRSPNNPEWDLEYMMRNFF